MKKKQLSNQENIIFRDENKIEHLRERLEEILPVMQRVGSAFAALGIGTLNKEELPIRVENDEAFIRNKIIEGRDAPLLGGVRISREAFAQQVELPEGVTELYAAFKRMRECYKNNWDNHSLRINIQEWFNFKEGGIVEIDEERFEKEVSTQFVFSAETENQIEYLNAVKEICDVLNKNIPILKKFSSVGFSSFEHRSLKQFEEGRFRPNEGEILSIRH